MDKLTMAHEYALKMAKQGIPLKSCKELGWKYADEMQAEAEKHNKAEAEKKRKEMREMLNAPNTFIEREGQHFDDVCGCEVDWRVAPDDATHYVIFADGLAYWYKSEKLEWFDIAPSFGIVGMCVVERPHGL